MLDKFRNVVTFGVYPWKTQLLRELSLRPWKPPLISAPGRPGSSGGVDKVTEKTVSEVPAGSDAETETDVTIEVDHKGEETKGETVRIKPLPPIQAPKKTKTTDRPVTRLFAPGEIAMTMTGAVRIVRVTDGTGEYCCNYLCVEADVAEPAEARDYPADDNLIWSIEDFPHWNFESTPPYRNVGRKEKELTPFSDVEMPEFDEEVPTTHHPEPPKPDHPYKLRSKSKVATKGAHNSEGKKGRDPQTQGEDLLIYLNSDTGELSTMARNRRTHVVRRVMPMAPLPEGTPSSFSEEELCKMDTEDVERMLPKHYHQTFGHPLQAACERGQTLELQDVVNREVFCDPQEIRPGEIVIGLMWVYAIKSKNGKYERVKGRITLMGNQERLQGLIGRTDAYAPVAQMITTRLLVAMHLGVPGIYFRKIDVKNAYINEYMRRNVRSRLPPGYTIHYCKNGKWIFRKLRKGEVAPRLSLRVDKALYGGMECGRIFWEAWVGWHLSDGFQIIQSERCYLHKRHPDGSYIKLGYHVDDNLVVGIGWDFYQAYLKRLTVKFDVTEGPLEEHLGVMYQFDMEKGVCHMSQSEHIRKFLKEFRMQDCIPSSTPSLEGPEPNSEDCKTTTKEVWDMQSFIGNCLWLVMCTRPDIQKQLKPLSRHPIIFGSRHVLAAKQILRFLKWSIGDKLTYRAGYPLYYQVFTDASHASCVDTRRSTMSVVVKLGGNTVYWRVAFTTIVSHSSTESELMALDEGATVLQALRWLIESMGGPIQGKIQCFVDNTSTLVIATNPVQPGRNAHVHARYFYVRDLAWEELLELLHCPTDLQLADIGCAYKGGLQYHKLRKYLMECARLVRDDHNVFVWEMLTDVTY